MKNRKESCDLRMYFSSMEERRLIEKSTLWVQTREQIKKWNHGHYPKN